MSVGKGIAIVGIWMAVGMSALGPEPSVAVVLGFFAMVATMWIA